MNANNANITIHMVSSLDGFIARKDGSVGWMQSKDHYPKGSTLNDDDITAFLKKIDCYVMGSKTYEQALELGWPYGNIPVIVLTSRSLAVSQPTVEFYSGDLVQLVQNQLKPKYKNIWMVGGAMLTREFIRLKLAHELVIAIMPVILGDGIPFFDDIRQEQFLHLKDVRAYQDGMVELSYEIKKEA